MLDNIDPRPLRLAMTSFEVDGFVAVLHVP